MGGQPFERELSCPVCVVTIQSPRVRFSRGMSLATGVHPMLPIGPVNAFIEMAPLRRSQIVVMVVGKSTLNS